MARPSPRFNRTIHVAISEAQHYAITVAAECAGITVAEWIRYAMQQELTDEHEELAWQCKDSTDRRVLSPGIVKEGARLLEHVRMARDEGLPY